MTKTYYLRSTGGPPVALHAGTYVSNRLAETTRGGAAGSISQSFGGSETMALSWFTPTDEPGVGAWPSGVYRVSVNVLATGADITYGFGTAAGIVGHLCRVAGAGSPHVVTNNTASPATKTGTGLYQATIASWAPGGTIAADRFCAFLHIARAASHGNQTLEVEVDSPTASWVTGGVMEGPWIAGGAVTLAGVVTR